jgi:hypothetical protein
MSSSMSYLYCLQLVWNLTYYTQEVKKILLSALLGRGHGQFQK